MEKENFQLTIPDLFSSESAGILISVLFLVLISGLWIYGISRKKVLWALFSDPHAKARLQKPIPMARQHLKLFFLVSACICALLALWRPQSHPQSVRSLTEGRDVVFLVDISRSMLAIDRLDVGNNPAFSRLALAQSSIEDVVIFLENARRGDRVGLIVFSGKAALKVPLTADYAFFRMMLSKIRVGDISQGGTNIGEALQAVERLMLQPSSHTETLALLDVILITDGDDDQSNPVEAAKRLGDKGISVYPVGFGSPDGSLIPIRDEQGDVIDYVRYPSGPKKGELVRPALNVILLQDIAAESGGKAVLVGGDTLKLDQIYEKELSVKEQNKRESQSVVQWTEWYQLPLFFAIIFLVAHEWVRVHTYRR